MHGYSIKIQKKSLYDANLLSRCSRTFEASCMNACRIIEKRKREGIE